MAKYSQLHQSTRRKQVISRGGLEEITRINCHREIIISQYPLFNIDTQIAENQKLISKHNATNDGHCKWAGDHRILEATTFEAHYKLVTIVIGSCNLPVNKLLLDTLSIVLV